MIATLLALFHVLDTGAMTAATWLIFVAAVPVNLVAALYYVRSNWRKYSIGGHFLTLFVGLALLIDISMLYWVLPPDYAGRGLIRFAVYSFIALGSWGMLKELVNAQAHRDELAESAEPTPPTGEAADAAQATLAAAEATVEAAEATVAAAEPVEPE